MEPEKVEKVIEKVANEAGVDISEVKALICALPIDKVKRHEAIVMIKMTLREVEDAQKAAKKKRREGSDSDRSKAQKQADHNAYQINQLLLKYNELRGKDPKVHSLRKWGYSD